MGTLAPVETRERVAILDVLRGFALLGVLLGNTFLLYSGMFAGGVGTFPAPTWLDHTAAWFVHLLVQSKAQTLLTFLFGLGFAMQLERARARGEPIVPAYVRRLLAMAGFGALHICLLWWGDVLWTYAVAGFVLLAFHRASNRARVIAAAILIVVPGAIMTLPHMRERAFGLFYPPEAWMIYTRDLIAAMRGSDHLAAMREHILFFPVFSAGGIWAYQPWLVGRFLLGQVAGAQRWFDRDGADHLPLFRRLLLWGGLVGTIGLVPPLLRMLKLRKELPDALWLDLTFGFLRELNYVGLAAAYMAAAVLLFQRPRWRRVLLVVAPAGRMPLTVYLSQSLIMTFLLYGWGLGWNEIMAPAGYVALSFAVFAVQVVACTLWLRAFRFGPLEWLWRMAVYGRRVPIR